MKTASHQATETEINALAVCKSSPSTSLPLPNNMGMYDFHPGI